MMPGTGEDEMVRQGHLDNPPRYGCFHLAVGTKLSKDEIIAIGRCEGWRTLYCSRGRFNVVEFWLENSLMIEFVPPWYGRSQISPQIGEVSFLGGLQRLDSAAGVVVDGLGAVLSARWTSASAVERRGALRRPSAHASVSPQRY